MSEQQEAVPHETHCGYVALLGQPNVGKSTLLNKLIGQKISITANKPQTTRHAILGIKTTETAQILFVDTPGLHHNKTGKRLNRYLNRAAWQTLEQGDIVVWLIDAHHSRQEDEAWIIEALQKKQCPVILAINKVDKIPDKTQLLPLIARYQEKMEFAAVIPISALKGKHVVELEQTIIKYLPVAPFLYSEDEITDRSERFLAAEMVREKLTRLLGQELPYALTVDIEQFVVEGNLTRIAAVIYVERPSQKVIVIGEGGNVLKKVGTQARHDLEQLLATKVYLQLWVKVKPGWSEDDRTLQQFGYKG